MRTLLPPVERWRPSRELRNAINVVEAISCAAVWRPSIGWLAAMCVASACGIGQMLGIVIGHPPGRLVV